MCRVCQRYVVYDIREYCSGELFVAANTDTTCVCVCICVYIVVAAGTQHSHARHVLGQTPPRFTLCSVTVVTDSDSECVCVSVCVEGGSQGPLYFKMIAPHSSLFLYLIFFSSTHSPFLCIFFLLALIAPFFLHHFSLELNLLKVVLPLRVVSPQRAS